MVLAKSLPSGVSAVPTPVKLFDGSEPSFKTELTYPFLFIAWDIANLKCLFLNSGTVFWFILIKNVAAVKR